MYSVPRGGWPPFAAASTVPPIPPPAMAEPGCQAIQMFLQLEDSLRYLSIGFFLRGALDPKDANGKFQEI